MLGVGIPPTAIALTRCTPPHAAWPPTAPQQLVIHAPRWLPTGVQSAGRPPTRQLAGRRAPAALAPRGGRGLGAREVGGQHPVSLFPFYFSMSASC